MDVALHEQGQDAKALLLAFGYKSNPIVQSEFPTKPLYARTPSLLSLCQTETSSSYYKEIPLSEILAINAFGDGYCFELKTAHVDYFCGDENDMGWEESVRQAYMPVICDRKVNNKVCSASLIRPDVRSFSRR